MNETMAEEMSGDTQAILLLCGRLGQTESGKGTKPLSAKQYGMVARWLRQRSMRPADLLSNAGRGQLQEFEAAGLDQGMLEALLDRGAALGLMTERWTSRGLWVISRGDAEYPARYKTYLGHSAPPLLFGAGDRDLLQAGGLAVVGSREADEEHIDFARRVGTTCAAQRIAVISGGARGIDIESMAASFEAGGSAVGVLADSLARSAVSARYREGLISGRLVLISPYDPEARWFAYTAMERNKLIYGLSDAALIVTSAAENGGTWSGATEALQHARISVYVRAHGTPAEGNVKLLALGAKAFPAESWGDLRSLFTPPQAPASLSKPPLEVSAEAPPADQRARSQKLSAGDAYGMVLPALLAALAEPRTGKAVEECLGLVPAQAKVWLGRACDEGWVRRLGRPARYVAVDESTLLFGAARPAEPERSVA